MKSSSTVVHRAALDKMDNIAEEESLERDLLFKQTRRKVILLFVAIRFSEVDRSRVSRFFLRCEKIHGFLSAKIMDKRLGTGSGIGCRFLDEEKTKKTKCRHRETMEYTLERKKRSFNRKPLNDHAKRSLQLFLPIFGVILPSRTRFHLWSTKERVRHPPAQITKTDLCERPPPRLSLNAKNGRKAVSVGGATCEGFSREISKT